MAKDAVKPPHPRKPEPTPVLDSHEVPGLLLLPARIDGSCDLHRSHGSAQPMLLQSHHVFPEYLQREAFGQTRDQERASLCGTGHDTVHVLLRALVRGDERADITPPSHLRKHRAEWRMAVSAYSRYTAAMAAKATK